MKGDGGGGGTDEEHDDDDGGGGGGGDDLCTIWKRYFPLFTKTKNATK